MSTGTSLDQIKSKSIRQISSVKELLVNDAAQGQLRAVAASHMNPERMMRIVSNALRTTPLLKECDPMSLLGGLMTCAAIGLEPNTILGHAYLIPFKNTKKQNVEVQVIVGYKGLIDLARRSGHITSISANIHYSDDELWDYEEGTDARLRHRPGPGKGKKLHAYAVAKFRDGGHAFVVLPWDAIIARRDNSQGWKAAVRFKSTASNPWFTHEDEMAKKTAIRSLSKYLPLSIEFMKAVELDEAKADFGSFAMNPEDDGPYIEPEEGAIEGSAAPVDEEQAPKSAAQQKKDETRDKAEPEQQKGKPGGVERKPAPRQDSARDEPETLGGDIPDDAAAYQSLFDVIVNALLDQPVEDVREAFADDIARMAKMAPGLHQRLEAEFAEFAKGQDQGRMDV